MAPRFALILFLSALVCEAAPDGAQGNFRLFTQPLSIPERGTVTSYVVLCESSRYSFLPPPGWLVRADAPDRKVALTPRDYTANIDLKFITKATQASEPQKPEQLRAIIQTRFAEARIIREFPCPASNGQGYAFDLEEPAPNNRKLGRRIAFVDTAACKIEIQLTTAPEKLTKYHLTFGNLLTSLRVEAPIGSK